MEKVYSDYKDLVFNGGDERIVLDETTGRNKYYINPLEYRGLINRGTCTCGTLNDFTEEVARGFAEKSFKVPFTEIAKKQEERIKKLFSPEQDRFEVFFAPSGSDLVYYSLLFAKLMHPKKPLVYFLTCPEELGQGSFYAAHGQYFVNHNQTGYSIGKGEFISDRLRPCVELLPARDEYGFINNHEKSIKSLLKKYEGYTKVGGLVIGSKSGIEDNLKIVDDTEEDVIWNVDLCQMRNNPVLINKLLDKGCLIQITGSKFYQAPPFCGALLVPKDFFNKAINGSMDWFLDFAGIFSKFDLPAKLQYEHIPLKSFKNYGLRMRWECALAEMEAYDNIEWTITYNKILEWNRVLIDRMQQSKTIELMPHQNCTNKSIISFRVKGANGFLGYNELQQLFKDVVTDRYNWKYGSKSVFIGQPVIYGQKSFLRIALGAKDVRELLKSPDPDFFNDMKIVDLIENKANKFC